MGVDKTTFSDYQVVRSNASAALLGKDPAKDCRFFLSNRLEEWVILERPLDKSALLSMHSSYWFGRLLILRLIPLLTLCMFAGSCSWDAFLINLRSGNTTCLTISLVKLVGFGGVMLSLFALWRGSMNVLLIVAIYSGYKFLRDATDGGSRRGIFYDTFICNDQALLDVLFWTAFQVPFWSLEPMAEQVPPPIIGIWGYKLISIGLAIHDVGPTLPKGVSFVPWGSQFTGSKVPLNIISWGACYWHDTYFAALGDYVLQFDVYVLILASLAILIYPSRSWGSLLGILHLVLLLYRLVSGTQVTLSLFISIVLCPAWINDSLLWCFFKQKDLRRVPLLLRADQVCTPWRPLSSFFKMIFRRGGTRRTGMLREVCRSYSKMPEETKAARDVAMTILLSSPVDHPDYCELIRKASHNSGTELADDPLASDKSTSDEEQLSKYSMIKAILRVIFIVLVWAATVFVIMYQYHGFNLIRTVAIIVTGFVLGIFVTAVLFPPAVFDSIQESVSKRAIEMAGRTAKAAWWCSTWLSAASLLIIWVLDVGWSLPAYYITAAVGIAAVTLQTVGRSGCVCYTHVAKRRRGRTLTRLMTGGISTAAYSSWVRIVIIRSIREIALLYMVLKVGIPLSPPPPRYIINNNIMWWPQLAISIHIDTTWHLVNLPYLPASNLAKPDSSRFVPQRLSFLVGLHSNDPRPQDAIPIKRLLCQTFADSGILLRYFVKSPPETPNVNAVRLERRWLRYHNNNTGGDDAIQLGEYFDENVGRREKLAELWEPCIPPTI